MITASTTGGISAIPSYLAISANETARIARFETTDAQNKSDIAYFTKQAPKITTADSLLKDYRSLGIVLNAFGMSANIGQTALLKKLMTQDPTSSTSLAQKLANPAYLRFAKAMNQFTTSPFTNQTNVNAVISAVGTNNYEAAQDAQSPGIADALYFKRTIGGLTTLTQLMSDPKLLTVATTATNMPSQFGTLDYQQQVNLLSPKIDMKKFADPSYVQKFITQYLAVNSANATASSPITTLFSSTGSVDITSLLVPSATSNATTGSLLSLFS